MKTFLKSIGLLGVMLAASLASAAQCPDLKVAVRNRTTERIIGGIWGNTGNLGSSGYVSYPGQDHLVGVYADNYPQGLTFGVVGVIQVYGQTDEYMSCTAVVRGVNGCPDPNTRTTMVITANGALATCKIYLQTITPPPTPLPTVLNYEFINNLGAGKVVSATVGVSTIFNGNPTTATKSVAPGIPVKGQIAIAANSSSVYVAGRGVSNGISGASCGPLQYSNLAGKKYVVTFSSPSVVNCTVKQQ